MTVLLLSGLHVACPGRGARTRWPRGAQPSARQVNGARNRKYWVCAPRPRNRRSASPIPTPIPTALVVAVLGEDGAAWSAVAVTTLVLRLVCGATFGALLARRPVAVAHRPASTGIRRRATRRHPELRLQSNAHRPAPCRDCARAGTIGRARAIPRRAAAAPTAPAGRTLRISTALQGLFRTAPLPASRRAGTSGDAARTTPEPVLAPGGFR
jgi:hypothetical protein